MITKKIRHNKYETCKLSKKRINTEKEDYAIILDCRGNEIKSFGFYKLDLLRDLIKGNFERVKNAVKENVMGDVMKTAKKMLTRMGVVN